ncbi:glycosyltransferase family 4 protein [Cellulomonas hominis]|uniref:glycosyltransferase family 4 protein n=1 Tax=Cellulomonas hominis TaxID=156981 RepID=UPI001BA39EB4|nr:glycosyltransferase family 4 protein [Cellulomonas hominis]VTR77846.1 GDP-mannose-dependent alpha-(1-6)-phosphatidylinositol monomannoside mannosyltransferase [Cellulomonas hominis]
MSRVAGVRALLRNLPLAGSAARGMLRQDPLLLVVQVSRRLPRGLSAAAARTVLAGRASGTRAVVGHWLAGRREQAAALLPQARPRRAAGRRLLAELAVELDRPDLVPDLPGATAARAAWRAGDLSGAVRLAAASGDHVLVRRYASDSATLRPGFAVPAGPPPRRAAPARGGPVALHLLTSSLPHTASGYALRSHAVLRAQSAAGIRVEAATRLGYPVSVGRLTARRTDVVDGVTYRRLLPSRQPATAVQRSVHTVELLRPVARALRPTVLHTTTPYGNGQVAAALASELGVPWVYEVRGLLEQTWVAGRPGTAQQAAAGASERFTLLRAQEAAVAASADHVVTLSETLRADLVLRGVAASRIAVVPNGVDGRLLTLPDEGPAATRRRLGLPGEGFWVGTVSSLVGYEGLDTLIDAVALLRRRGVDVRACVVGDGVARPELERHAHDAGVGGTVLFPGRVPSGEAPRWHQALDVFVVPRRDVEVCRRVTPLKPVEAMALGRPVVASDLPALAEVLAGGAGRLVPADEAVALADAIAALRGDEAVRTGLVRAGREVAAGRTWARSGRLYRDLYGRIGADA